MKNVVRIFWALLILGTLIFCIARPDLFKPKNISGLINEYKGNLLFLYAIVSLLKGFLLVPTTPFIVAGVLLFPEMPFQVFFISVLGIVIGGAGVYFFTDRFKLLGDKYNSESSRFKKINSALRKNAFWIVFAWSIFPITPTNVVCYVAGASKTPFWRFWFGLLLGQGILIGFYVFGGTTLLLSWLE